MRTRRPPAEPPKRFDEDVAHRGAVEVEVAEAAEAAARAGARAERPGPAVVLLALLGVAEHVVRLGDLLEARLGVLVARVAVRVIVARQLAVGLLDLLGGGALVDARASCSSPVEQPSAPRPPPPRAPGAGCSRPACIRAGRPPRRFPAPPFGAATVATASCRFGSKVSPSGLNASMPARASAAASRIAPAARLRAAGRPPAPPPSRGRGCRAPAAAPSRARPRPRSCALAASRATRLR